MMVSMYLFNFYLFLIASCNCVGEGFEELDGEEKEALLELEKQISLQTTFDADHPGRTSDEDMKTAALNNPLVFFDRLQCSSRCPFNQTCISRLNLCAVCGVRMDYWDRDVLYVPSSSQRRKQLIEFMKSCYVAARGEFFFMVGDQRVCELAMIWCLGISFRSKLNDAPGMWHKVKHIVKEGLNYNKDFRKNRRNDKASDCRLYISIMALQAGDTTPYEGNNY